jgi:S-DNA-T family DNA segregation ATPase FtsK/SpoIIIE
MGSTVTRERQQFRRSARVKPPAVPEGVITLAPPPKVDQLQQGITSWLQYLFPVVGSLGAMLFIANNPKPLYFASGMLFMLGSVGMGVGMAMQQRASVRRRKRGARAQYLEYIGGVRVLLRKTAAAQLAASAWRHPAPDALLSLTRSTARVWARRPDEPDFLQLRAGEGSRPLATPLKLPEADGPATAADPVCLAAVEELVRTHGTVSDEAIVIDLKDAPVVSIVGTRAASLDLARALVCQLAVTHAPDDVRLLLLAPPSLAKDWDWTKWLPHLESGDPESLLNARVAQARRSVRGQEPPAGAWLVVVADGETPNAETIAALRKQPGRTSVIVLAGNPTHEPGEVAVRLRVEDGHLEIEHLESMSGREVGRADRLGSHSAEAVARRLAPLRLTEETSAPRLADDISLTSLIGIRDLNTLDPSQAWRPRPLADILTIPIGVSSEGEVVRLDFKESALGGDGPHGLVIGATGSGKSELLRTIVTGLALTHPPDRLAFVLVDFKGGAAFAGLQELPHVAGLITNLADDLALIDRMHAALFGEIRRRQELLRAAGNLATVREYHRHLEAGEALDSLPYLLVIVDEFGELLTARPEFIDLFVAVGRLGRSLGMHLLLGSQQLDEGRLRGLEGHLSYRIALRTFSAAESRTVLGVPDAYELPPLPGSAYLKVGTTVYTRFRAAVVSQPYHVTAEAPSADRPRPFYLSTEKPVEKSTPVAVESAFEASMLDVAVARLRGAAARVHQVWLPPLESRVPLDAVLGAGLQDSDKLVVPLGLVDKPAEQARGILTAEMSGSAGHLLIVGASLTGKTTLLRTLVSALALTQSPLEAQVYCVDFGGGGLAPLSGLPHVGGVAGRQDPERVRRTVVEVAAMLDEREARFEAAGIDSLAALRARRGRGELEGTGWADVFLVVDNWPAVRQEFEDLEPLLLEIAARGLGYAVHLVLTASRWIDVRSSLRESIGGRLELRLHDPGESAINRREAENVARGVPGRGITSDGLHFQAALPRIDGSTETLDQHRGLDGLIEKVNSGWNGPRARPVLVLPRMVELSALLKDPGGPGIVIGVSELDLKPVRIDPAGDPHFLVFGDGESGKTNFLRTFVLGLMAASSPKQVQILLIDYRRTLLGVVPSPYLVGYGGAEPAATAQVAEAAGVLTRRLPPADISIDQLRARSWWKGPEVYVVADDYDLVVTPGGSPLAPLLPLLAQAKDVGLHLVVARRAGGSGRGILEQLLLRLRELGSPGLLLSGDPQEGPLLGAYRAGPQPPGRGLLVRRREKASLIQVAFSGSESS